MHFRSTYLSSINCSHGIIGRRNKYNPQVQYTTNNMRGRFVQTASMLQWSAPGSTLGPFSYLYARVQDDLIITLTFAVKCTSCFFISPVGRQVHRYCINQTYNFLRTRRPDMDLLKQNRLHRHRSDIVLNWQPTVDEDLN